MSRSRIRRIAAAAALAAACALTLASAALAGPPIGHVYGCYGNGGFGLQYDGSFKLQSKSVYQWATDQAGKKLVGKTHTAKYKLKGNKLTFLTGPYAHMLGLWIPASKAGQTPGSARINLYKPTYKNWTGISCQLS